MAKMIKITLTKSTIGASPKQKKVVEALGLKDAPLRRGWRTSADSAGAVAKGFASCNSRRNIRRCHK